MASRYRIHAAALHYFDAVRRAGSIRAAARRLNVASSAVNRQILALEAEIGTPLFERLPAGLKLTGAGESLAHHVIGVLRDAERLASQLDALKGLQAGHVELVSLEGLCHRIVPDAIAAMARRYPRVTIGVGILDTGDIPGAIASGDADLGLAFEVHPRPELRRIAAARFHLGAVVPSDSPLAKAPSLSLNDLRDHPVILPQANFANREQLLPALVQAGMNHLRGHEAGSVELMKQLVLRRLGIALMTRVGLEAELEAGQLAHIPLRQTRGFIDSDLGLFARSNTPLSLAAEMFAQHLADSLARATQTGSPPEPAPPRPG
jgi:DNA-binding transcriptional LysR family regulator